MAQDESISTGVVDNPPPDPATESSPASVPDKPDKAGMHADQPLPCPKDEEQGS